MLIGPPCAPCTLQFCKVLMKKIRKTLKAELPLREPLFSCDLVLRIDLVRWDGSKRDGEIYDLEPAVRSPPHQQSRDESSAMHPGTRAGHTALCHCICPSLRMPWCL